MSKARGADPVSLAFSEVAGVWLALEAEAALRFGAARPGALDAGPRWLDAARLLGQTPDPDQERRWALFETSGAPLAVLLGGALAIRPVALSALHPLPELLAPTAARLGCAGLVAEPDRYCFLLDPRLLAELAERPDLLSCA